MHLTCILSLPTDHFTDIFLGRKTQMLRALAAITVLLCLVVIAWVYQQQRTIENGQAAFMRYGCPSCHFAGGAPNLQNVSKKYDRAMLTRFIEDPNSVYAERQNRPLNQGFNHMPRIKTDPDDVKAIVAYLQTLSD